MNLNRKAMVLAVGAALAAPGVHAQITSKAGSEWEFYGKFYPEIVQVKGSGETAAGAVNSLVTATGTPGIVDKNAMQVSNSYLGFRGSKDIGGGRRALWQVESQVAIDEGASTLADRDSFMGFTDKWGTIRLGNMDTPFKKYGDTVGFLGVSSGNFVTTSNVMRKNGFTGSASSFNLRRANAVMYDSPQTGGVQAAVSYSVGNPTESSITTQNNPRVISAGVKYETGPLYLAAAHEIHWDLFGGGASTANSKDTATQFTVQYKMGIHTLEADINFKEYKESNATTGQFSEYKNTAGQLVMENRWSNQWRTAFHYVRANKGSCKLVNAGCTTDGLEGTQISAGVSYYLDPSFYLFGLYSVVRNGTAARYDSVDIGTPSAGEDTRQIAGGIAYTF